MTVLQSPQLGGDASRRLDHQLSALSSALARPRAIYPVAARVVEDTLALVVALDKLERHHAPPGSLVGFLHSHPATASGGHHNDFVNEGFVAGVVIPAGLATKSVARLGVLSSAC